MPPYPHLAATFLAPGWGLRVGSGRGAVTRSTACQCHVLHPSGVTATASPPWAQRRGDDMAACGTRPGGVRLRSLSAGWKQLCSLQHSCCCSSPRVLIQFVAVAITTSRRFLVLSVAPWMLSFGG